jgi:long-chain acyl-CoA synthetase
MIYASPYHYSLLAKDASELRLDSVRLAISTATGLREETARLFFTRFGRPIVQALGIIEVGLPVINLAHAEGKPTSLGQPLPDYSVWLRGEDGHAVDATSGSGAVRGGEVCIRGPGLFDAYLDPWSSAEELTRRDGFRTGDEGFFDADGDLHLIGRRQNRISMAGMKFFAEEVEDVLDSHPEVTASRVYAQQHAQLGDLPVAEIVVRDPNAPPATRELNQYCRVHLPSYKIPRRYEIVEALPLTETGKVRRWPGRRDPSVPEKAE